MMFVIKKCEFVTVGLRVLQKISIQESLKYPIQEFKASVHKFASFYIDEVPVELILDFMLLDNCGNSMCY